MIRLDNVSVSYKDQPVLNNISLSIREGEKVALIGPSGAGKTTLLKKLYELQHPHAAFIHQDFALVPQLSAFHNVYIGRLDQNSTLYNLLNLLRPKKREVDQISGILEILGMQEKMFERVSKLSGGQQQRLAVARAIFRGSDLLLGDEPISSVDPHQSATVLKLLKRTARTVIVSLHDVEFALRFFERIIGLSRGQVHFDLPVKKVTNSLLAELYQSC
jgi:phosphonate transport system ATP-binding protein